MVGGKCLIPWRAPPCVGRGRRISYPCCVTNSFSFSRSPLRSRGRRICLLQLLFGSSKLQATGFQKGPFATAKQHLIACRNRAQTYPQKLLNVPSEFQEKNSLFLCIRPEGTLRHSKTAPNCVPKPCSNLSTKTAYCRWLLATGYVLFYPID